MTQPDLEAAVVALARRSRRGVNEATVWTMLHPWFPSISPADCHSTIERLIEQGRLYRDQRRRWALLKVAEPVQPAAATLQEQVLF